MLIVSPSATKTSDLGQRRETVLEHLDLVLERRAHVADDQPGDEDGEEPGAVGHGRRAVDDPGEREGAAPCGAPPTAARRAAGGGSPASPPAIPIASPIDICSRKTRTTTQKRRVARRRELEQPEHQRDPDRDRSPPTRPRGSSRFGRRSRARRAPRTSPPDRSARSRRRAARRDPAEAEHAVHEQRDEPRGREGAEDPERRDRHRRDAEAPQPIEEPPSKRMTISATVPIRSTEWIDTSSDGKSVRRDGCGDEKEGRRGDRGPGAHLRRGERRRERAGDDQHRQAETRQVVHGG